MEVDAQGDGGDEPAEDADGGSGGEPVPPLVFDVRGEVVDEREEEDEESGCDGPRDEAQGDLGRELRDAAGEVEPDEAGEEVAAEQGDERDGDEQREQDGDEDGGAARLPVGPGFPDLVDGVEGVLDGGEADGGGPERGGKTEGDLAAAGAGGGLVEGLENDAKAEGGMTRAR